MDIEVKGLHKKDFKKAIAFAIKGMNFERYTNNKWELAIYGRYFLYLEMQRATHVFGAYLGDQLVGVLMADMKGGEKNYRSLNKKIYTSVVETIMNLFFNDGIDGYDEANKTMYQQYTNHTTPDGEICFLVTDDQIQGKGIGTQLLRKLEEVEKGKRVFLYTDSNCTYQFYEHRGFNRVEEKDIKMDIHGRDVFLACYLYDKIL